MHDPRRKKMLDMRRAHRRFMRPCLYDLFRKLHPEACRSHSSWRYDTDRKARSIWLCEITGGDWAHHRWCRAEKWVRKYLTKKRRVNNKQLMQKICVSGDYEMDTPATHRKDAKGWC